MNNLILTLCRFVKLSLGPLFALAFAGTALGSVPVLRSADLTPSVDLYRVVLIFPGEGEKRVAFRDQLDQWNADSVRTPMVFRSVHVFQVVDPQVIAALRKQMAPNETGFHVWVIGLSGQLVLSTDRGIEPREIFDLIDTLPRWREEARLGNAWDADWQRER